MIVGGFAYISAAAPSIDRWWLTRVARTRSIASDTPCPTPTHIVASARLPPCFDHLVRRRQREPRARHAERMAERDGAAVRIDVLGVVGSPSWRRHASACEAKASFNSITSKSPILRP